MNIHDTYDRRCRQLAIWAISAGFLEGSVIALAKDWIAIRRVPFIQRQAFAERVWYYYLVYRGVA